MDKKKVTELFFGYGCVITDTAGWGQSFHRHDEIQFGFFEKGPVDYQLGGHLHRVEAHESILFWATIPHLLVDTPEGNTQYWLTMPLDIFIQWGLPEGFTHAVLNGRMLKADNSRFKALDRLSLQIWKDDFAAGNKEVVRVITLAIESRIRRFGLACREALGLEGSIVSTDRKFFAKVYDYIAKNYQQEIRIEAIAEEVGVHPNYLMAAFKKSCGQSIGKVITMMRIYEAQRLLTTTDMKIIDISYESGFGSLSSFYNCFKNHCGKSPRKYRAGG